MNTPARAFAPSLGRSGAILALAMTYVTYAMLLNSVGTVILQSIATFGVSKPTASLLEACKDLSIAGATLLVATRLPAWGLRRGMAAALALVGLACLLMPILPGFGTTELLFVVIGVSFAVVKTAVYASIGLLARDAREHATLTSVIEGLFMVGVMAGGWLFSAFVNPRDPADPRWLGVYGVLAALALGTASLCAWARWDESAARHEAGDKAALSPLAMLRLAGRPLVGFFLASAFLYVLVEQSFSSWLPTFNREVLHLPNRLSIELATLLAGSTALGRLAAGAVVRRVPWYPLLVGSVVGMAIITLVCLPIAGQAAAAPAASDSLPAVAWLLPLIGLLMAPIYPVLNSVVLSNLPRETHAAMTGLIIIFSALGGTLGSRITATVFAWFGGVQAFYFTLVPMALLIATLTLFRRRQAD